MDVTVKYFATIRACTGESERRLNGAPADLRELLTALTRLYGSSFRGAVLSGVELSEAVIILVNGRNVRYLGGLDAPIAADDEVSIFPMVGGG